MELTRLYFLLLNFYMLVSRSMQLETGDKCTLKDGTEGICKVDRQCPYVTDLLKKGKAKEVVSCGGFQGRYQIVCCKEKFSQRFSTNVLCDGKDEKRPSKPVRFEDHLVNGVEADVAEFPHLAAIGYMAGDKTEYQFRCGGTLISEDFVLTAAHCCNRRGEQPLMVRLGKTSLHDDTDNEAAQDILVKKIYIHEEFSSQSKINDIALIQLQKPAVLAHNVWPACLSSDTRGLMKKLSISGFGVKNVDDKTTSTWLLKGNVDEVQLGTCQEKFAKLQSFRHAITRKQVCAHNPVEFTDTCQGDSGGPMEYSKNKQAYVYGVTSFGLGCGSPELPSVYTRVDEYIDWIYQKMSS